MEWRKAGECQNVPVMINISQGTCLIGDKDKLSVETFHLVLLNQGNLDGSHEAPFEVRESVKTLPITLNGGQKLWQSWFVLNWLRQCFT